MLCLLTDSCRLRNWRWRWPRHFLKEGIWYEANISADFEMFLQITGCKIRRYHGVIPPSIWLAVTLRYLASGEDFTSLMYTFNTSKHSISAVIREMCKALIIALKTYIKVMWLQHVLFYMLCSVWHNHIYIFQAYAGTTRKLITGTLRAIFTYMFSKLQTFSRNMQTQNIELHAVCYGRVIHRWWRIWQCITVKMKRNSEGAMRMSTVCAAGTCTGMSAVGSHSQLR